MKATAPKKLSAVFFRTDSDAEPVRERLLGPEHSQEGHRTMSRNRHLGSPFDDFLREYGLLEEVDAAAIKRVLAWQLHEAMARQRVTKVEMARRMRTSRSQLDRFLDPSNDRVLLETVHRAASALGKRVVLQLEDANPPSGTETSRRRSVRAAVRRKA